MTCKQFRKRIPLAIGNDLDGDALAVFDEHLRSCLACYREYRDFADAMAELDVLRAPDPSEPPDELVEAILAEVRAAEPGPLAPHPTPFWARSRLVRNGVPVAAAVVVFSFAGLMVFGDRGNTTQRTAPRIPDDEFLPTVVNVAPGPADQFGTRYIFPVNLHPNLTNGSESRRPRSTEPLPPAVVPISHRNDF